MFGIGGSEFVVLLILVAALIGPESVIKGLKGFKSAVESLKKWSAQLREETKGETSHTDMPTLTMPTFNLDDYDPREIIRRAVREEMTEWVDEVAISNAAEANKQTLHKHDSEHSTEQATQLKSSR